MHNPFHLRTVQGQFEIVKCTGPDRIYDFAHAWAFASNNNRHPNFSVGERLLDRINSVFAR